MVFRSSSFVDIDTKPVSASGLQTAELLTRALQVLLCLLGVVNIVWAVSAERFRDANNWLTGNACLPLTMGVALLLLGCSFAGSWRRFASWFALAAVGQAVALQMIDAGRLIHYQHYQSPVELVKSQPLLLLLLAVQIAIVTIGLVFRWSSIRGWCAANFRLWQLVVIALIFGSTAAALSRSPRAYLVELAIAVAIQLINLAGIVLLARSVPQHALERIKEWGENLRSVGGTNRLLDRFALTVAAWVLIMAALLSFFIYQRHPHVPDEVSYVYQANYMSQGRLGTPAPPVPEAFSFYLIPYEATRWHSIFSPGWPALLSLGVVVGAGWLVNPVLAAVSVLLANWLLTELYSKRLARLTIILLGASPWFIFMAMSYMSHTFTLACFLAAAAAMCRARTSERARWALLSGAAVGVVSLIRPLDGLLVASLLGFWAIGIGATRLNFRSLVAFVAGTAAVGALVLPYNKRLTGSALLMPMDAYYNHYYWPKAMALGFGPQRGLGWGLDAWSGHSPLEAMLNATLNAFSLNTDLLGWGMGSLLFLALALVARKRCRSDRLMLATICAIVIGYGFYWYSGGPDFGPRYWFLIVVPVLAMTARGIQVLQAKLRNNSADGQYQDARVLVAVLSLCVMSLLSYLPWRALDKYHDYLGMNPGIRTLEREHPFGNGLVLVRGNDHPDYASAWIYNPLDPQSRATVFAWDRSPAVRRKLLIAYKDRPIWIVDGPTLTGSTFRINGGPFTANQLLAQK